MIYIVIGSIVLLLGCFFYWLNTNSPMQTPFPMVLLPVGAVLLIVGLARVLP